MTERNDETTPTKRFVEGERLIEQLMSVEATHEDAGLFGFLAGASFLEGTLRFPGGRKQHFEWDADAGGLGLREFLLDLLHTEAARQKYRRANPAPPGSQS